MNRAELQTTLRECVRALEEARADDALTLADSCVKQWPNLGLVHHMRGRALLEMNQFDDAIEPLQRAIALDPGSGEAQASLGTALQSLGRVKESYEAFIRALSLAPDSTGVQVRAAGFLAEQGELDEAEKLFSLAAKQHNVSAISGLVSIREKRGDLDGAIAFLESNRASMDGSISLRLTYVKLLQRKGLHDEGRTQLEQVDPETLTPITRVAYYHALGDVLDQLDQTDRAFTAYQQANALRNVHYDADHQEALTKQLIDFYDGDSVATMERTSCTSGLPIFIVGMPRSGTSLVEQTLACHPHVHGAGELNILQDLAGHIDLESPADLENAASHYLAYVQKLAPDAAHITDKMPHNFLLLGLVAQLFPKAHIIHCSRDPIDTGLSCFCRNFLATHSYATDLQSIGHFIQQHDRLMKHWKAVLPNPILTVEYEDLVTQFRPKVAEVLSFCELEWDEGVLQFHQSGRVVRTASYDQVRKPVYTKSVGRARRYWEQLAPVRAMFEPPTAREK